MNRWLLKFALLMIVTSIWTPALAQVSGALNKIPVEDWESLGFQAPGTEIGPDDYLQLRMALYVRGQKDSALLAYCPKSGLWDFDLKGLLGGDSSLQLGVQVEAAKLPISSFTPLKITRTGEGGRNTAPQYLMNCLTGHHSILRRPIRRKHFGSSRHTGRPQS